MKLQFEIETDPQSFDSEDDILNTLNDVGLRNDIEVALSTAIEQVMWWHEIRVVAKLKEWK